MLCSNGTCIWGSSWINRCPLSKFYACMVSCRMVACFAQKRALFERFAPPTLPKCGSLSFIFRRSKTATSSSLMHRILPLKLCLSKHPVNKLPPQVSNSSILTISCSHGHTPQKTTSAEEMLGRGTDGIPIAILVSASLALKSRSGSFCRRAIQYVSASFGQHFLQYEREQGPFEAVLAFSMGAVFAQIVCAARTHHAFPSLCSADSSATESLQHPYILPNLKFAVRRACMHRERPRDAF